MQGVFVVACFFSVAEFASIFKPYFPNHKNYMNKKTITGFVLASLIVTACDPFQHHPNPGENFSLFTKIDEIQLQGGNTAAEISAYDPKTKRLFVVNAVKQGIDVLDMSDPFDLKYLNDIDISVYGAGVNSVTVKNGLLAAAVESSPKTDPGKVVVWKTDDLSERAVITVGALPDMVKFSHNGRYIVSANEGEPNEDYTIDPLGSVSIIDVQQGFNVKTLDFTSFNSRANALIKKGFRVAGPAGTTLAQDVEPEYVAISEDNKYAWVTLQENNGIAKVNLTTKKIEDIFPLGRLDHSLAGNELDPSDRDGMIAFARYPVKGIFQPDGIDSYRSGGTDLIVTVNEGDSRVRPTSDDAIPGYAEGELFNEETRIGSVTLDPVKFPNAAELKTKLARLKITNRDGDIDGDGDFDELHTFGTRSFTIWDGNNGRRIWDSGNKLTEFLISQRPGLYDDDRSDDKGIEPENIAIGKIGNRVIAFLGLERADAIAVVDITSPTSPVFVQILETNDAPEGVLFIPAKESPNGRSTLVVSCEGDGVVNVFQMSASEEEMVRNY